MDQVRVVHAPEKARYEIWVSGELAGYAEYDQVGQVLHLTSTQIFPEFERRGLGSVLVEGLVVDVRERGLRVLPVCPFIKWWAAGHAECGDVLEPEPPTSS